MSFGVHLVFMNIYPKKKDIREILKVTQSSPYLWVFFFGPPNPSFRGICKLKKFYSILVMKKERQYETHLPPKLMVL
jgi:hypothetical protein